MRKKRTDAGFSLVELLVVIGGIAILAAIAIPSIASFLRTYHIRGASQEVRATMQTARLKAVANNVHTGVLFVVVDNKHYQWAIEDRLEAGANPGQERGRQIDAKDLVGKDWPGQVGPLQMLPGQVEFSATECPGFAPNNSGLRFGNLGTMCAPGSDTKCPALDAGAKLVVTDDNGGAVCVAEVGRQQYLVHVSTSGVIKADFVEPTP